jgi:cytidyltransferase-like protein
MRVIYTKIVADLFHSGHVNFLKEARSRGDKLVVHVVDDERVSAYKGRPTMTQKERLLVVESCKYVDEVVENGPKVITRSFLVEHGYTAYAFGFANETEKSAKLADCGDLPPEMIEIIDYTPDISSTELKNRIRSGSNPKRIHFIRNIFFYAALFFILLVGSVVVDRIVGFSMSVFGDVEKTDTNGIHFAPNSSRTLTTDEFSYTVVSNKFGLRSPEIELVKPDSTYRILAIGDSWTLGYGVENHEAWPQVLQQVLEGKSELNIEVVNAGLSGSGPKRYAETLDETIELFSPDLVLVGVLQVNDLTDILLNENPEVRSHNRSVSITSIITSVVNKLWPNGLKLVRQWRSDEELADLRSVWRMSVFNLIKNFDPIEKIRYDLLSKDVRTKFESGNLNPQLLRLYIHFPERPFVFNEATNVKSNQILDDLANRMNRLKETSSAHGSDFAVIHLPMNFYTGDEVIRNTFDQLTPYLANQNRIDSLMKFRLDQLQIENLFLTEAFKESNQTEPLFFKYDGHPTPAGHRLIAENIASWEFLQLELSTQH